MRVRLLALLCCLTQLVVLVGCFEYTEETWVNPDGTGRLMIDLAMSEALVAMGAAASEEGDALAEMAEEFDANKAELETMQSVEKVDYEIYSEAGMRHFVVDIQLRDLEEFVAVVQAAQPERDSEDTEGMTPAARHVELERLPHGKVRYYQRLRFEGPEEAEPEPEADPFGGGFEEMGKAFAMSFFADKYYTVILHAPRVVSTNGRLDQETQTVTWRVPLTEMLATGGLNREFEAELQMPRVNWTMLAAVGVGACGFLAVLAIILVLVVQKRRKVPTASPES